MIIYIGILFLVCAWILLEKKALNRKAIWVPASILIIFATIRDYTIGTDTHTYTKPFRFFSGLDNYFFDPQVEMGYQYLVYILLHLTSEYYILFLITSIIIIFGFFYVIKKYSVDYFLSVYIFITFSIYTFYFNTLRQAIAIVICMLGLKFLLEKKLFKYLIFVALASLFHISALIMIPIYFLVHLKIKIHIKLLTLFFSSLLGSSLIINYLAQDNTRYQGYTEQADNAGGYSLYFLYVFIGLFVYVMGRDLRNKNHVYYCLEQIFLFGLIFVLPIILLGTNPSGPQRILYNFSFYLILILPYIFNKFDSIIPKYLFMMFSLIFYVLATTSIYEIYPYKLNPLFEIF